MILAHDLFHRLPGDGDDLAVGAGKHADQHPLAGQRGSAEVVPGTEVAQFQSSAVLGLGVHRDPALGDEAHRRGHAVDGLDHLAGGVGQQPRSAGHHRRGVFAETECASDQSGVLGDVGPFLATGRFDVVEVQVCALRGVPGPVHQHRVGRTLVGG